MKFKSVVASLIVLGVTAPVFADGVKSDAAQQSVVDQNSLVNTLCSQKWFDRITVGGVGDVIGAYGDHDLPGAFTKTSNASDIYVNNANLLVDAELNKWSKASLNLAYLGAPSPFYMKTDNVGNNYNSISNGIFVDEVYAVFSDFSKSPYYAKVGRAYVPFGEYNDKYVPWQVESPAQMITQTNGPTAIVGVASDNGYYASVFALKGDTHPAGSSSNNIRNFGAKVGYKGNLAWFSEPNVAVNFNVSAIRNMWDSRFFTPNNNSPASVGSATDPRDPVGAIAVHADMSYHSVKAYADFASALKNMASTYYTGSGTAADPYTKSTYSTNSSSFWGANVNAAYDFATLAHDSTVDVGVQFSGCGSFLTNTATVVNSQNSGLFSYIIPKWRAVAEYKVNLMKHVDAGLTYAYSRSYSPFNNVANIGGSRSSNVGYARLGVKF